VPRTTKIAATLAVVLIASCHRAAKAPEEPVRPLSGFAVQRLVVAPTGHVRSGDSLSWVQMLGGPKAMARRLDTSIVAALDARGLASRWILPAALSHTYERNRTYASDPYQLVIDQLRGPNFKTGERYGEPLSSQLRTMIALEDNSRYVLLPVDLRFEKTNQNGRAVLRLALLDPRATEAKWVGDVKGDPASSPTAALASLAEKIADLFIAP
jgi:hypothetical protein